MRTAIILVAMVCVPMFAGVSDAVRIDVIRGEISLGEKHYTQTQSCTARPEDTIVIPAANTALAVTVQGATYHFVTDRPMTMTAAKLVEIIRTSASHVKDRIQSERMSSIIFISVAILSLIFIMALAFFISRKIGEALEKKREANDAKKLTPMVMSAEIKKRLMDEYRK